MTDRYLHGDLSVLHAGDPCYAAEHQAHTECRCLQKKMRLNPPDEFSHLASRIWSQANWRWSLFAVCAAETGRKQWAKEAAKTFPEDAVREAVDETVAETVADRQPCCEEGCHLVVIQPGALQKEVEDVRHPQHVEDTGDSEQHHCIAFVRAALDTFTTLTFITLYLWVEASVALGDLLRVLSTDPEYTSICEANNECSWCIEHSHNEGAEPRVGSPGVCTPLKYVPMIARLPPAEKGWQKNQSRINPDENDANPQPARCHQRGVGQWACDGDIAVHADARQRGHWDALQDRNHVAKHLAGKLLVQASEVVEEGQWGHQAGDTHEQISVGHGLDKVAGGVVVQQWGTVENKDYHQVASYDEHSEEEDDNHLQHAGIQAVGVTHGAQKAERGRDTLVSIRGRVHFWTPGKGRGGKGEVFQVDTAVIRAPKSLLLIF